VDFFFSLYATHITLILSGAPFFSFSSSKSFVCSPEELPWCVAIPKFCVVKGLKNCGFRIVHEHIILLIYDLHI